MSFLSNIGYAVFAKFAFAISYIISTIAGVAVMLETWILGFLFNISIQVTNSPLVSAGFPISLAIANLGFVLAIIVIAVATIFRVGGYGAKDALWRLIVMALLVNFGLVLCGVVIGFSDQVSLYFLNSATPTGSTFTSTVTNSNNFASALAGAFNPQRNLSFSPSGAAGGTTALGSTFGGILTAMISIVFTIFAMIFIIITLGALIIMLVVRYVYLSFLFVILPLAWAGWIFPSTRSWFSKWWSKFINQAFFAPAVLFFLWLAIRVAEGMSSATSPLNTSAYTTSGNSAFASLRNFFGTIAGDVLTQFLQMSVLLGIIIGGLIAAQSMGAYGAGAAHGYATGLGQSFGSWSKKRAARAGQAAISRPLRSERVGNAASGLQNASTPGFRNRFLNRYDPAKWAGRGLAAAQQKAQEQKSFIEEGIKGMDEDSLASNFRTLSDPQKMIALKRLQEKGKLGLLEDLDEHLDNKKIQGLFKQYGEDDALKSIENSSGRKLRKLINTKNEAVRLGAESEEAKKAQEELDKYYAQMTDAKILSGYFGKIETKDGKTTKVMGFGEGEDDQLFEYQKEIARGLATKASNSAAGKMFAELNRGDKIALFEKAAKASGVKASDMSRGMKKYLGNSTAADLGIGPETYGLSKQDLESNPENNPTIITDDPRIRSEQERNVRSTTTFS